MLSLPQLPHFIFDASLDLTVREGFRFGDKVFAGVQWTSWQRDDFSWNHRLGRFGRQGTMYGFMRVVPRGLRVSNSTEESHGSDPLARTSAGTLEAAFELAYANDIPVRGSEVRLYSCANGTFQSVAVPLVSATTTATFNGVAAGSYILWARCFDGGVGGSPPTVPLEAIMADARNAGEWSALKVQVGSGAYSVATGVCPGPGGPLYVKDGAAPVLNITATGEAVARVNFDPLARSVSASGVLHSDISRADGTVDVAAGSQIIAGLRGSRSGPQSALWHLKADLTARLLATTPVFSNGMCECGKSDHHASDVCQAPDGTLYLLNECSLHLYAPDAAAVTERLPGSPARNGGHPGGQSLRFIGGRPIFSTELLVKAPTDLGVFYYDRLVERANGRDSIGCGTIWHGPGNTEVFRGNLWGFRGNHKDFREAETQIFFDSIDKGVWRGTGPGYDPRQTFWRQLRRRGALLFWFGFNPHGHLDTNGPETQAGALDGTLDTPLCAVADGNSIQQARLDFLVKRATRCPDDAGGETLLLTGNDTATGQSFKNGGRALRVLELPSPSGGGGGSGGSNGSTKLCSFWNAGAGEFRVSQATFAASGGDVTKLPLYFRWRPQSGSQGGGVWVSSSSLPASPYLGITASGGIIRLKLFGTAPYDFTVWGLICFQLDAEGAIVGPFRPDTSCPDAECAVVVHPEGSQWRVISRPCNRDNPLTAIQLTDLDADKALTQQREIYPSMWARYDSIAPLEDLSTYKHLVRLGRAEPSPMEVNSRVDVVVIVIPTNQPCHLPALGRRFN